jgi:hypothetical protein
MEENACVFSEASCMTTPSPLRLAVYGQSVRHGVKLLETQNHRFFFCNRTLKVIVRTYHPLLREDVFVSYEYASPLSSVRITHKAYFLKFFLLHYILVLCL